MGASSSSHLVLARKWRPERFGELVGQEHVTRTLVRALESGRIAHAFLFTGIRGVGKTSAARILARCLNCAKGPTPEPCGECAACVEVRAGTALDVVEIDGATYRKIDDARAIIENLSYRPARDRFKVYIIDEAHQLTDQAFNALLKTLEEPPAHVKFILATTEPQKMPETILSRLQRYDFRRIPFAVILGRLKELAAREGLEADEGALRLLAREACGSMRDAERMLETAAAPLAGRLSEEEAAACLGVAARGAVFAIIEAVLARDAGAALKGVRSLYARGANLESLGRDLLEGLRNLAVAGLSDAGTDGPLDAMPDHEQAELRRLATTTSQRDLMRLFRLMAQAQEEIIRSPYPDLLLEMAVVRMASLAPVMDADELMKALGLSGGSPSGAPGGKPNTAASSPAPGATRRLRVEGEVKASAPLRSPPEAPTNAIAAPPAQLADLYAHIRARRPGLYGFMEQGAALALEGDLITITPRSEIYTRYLADNRGVIAQLAAELYRRPIRAEIERVGAMPAVQASPPRAGGDSTPAQPPGDASAAGTLAAGDDARKAVYADPLARRIFDQLEARLVEVREAKSSKQE